MPKKQTNEPAEDLNLTFEQAYKELETIVAQLEQGDLPLEQSLALHARGQKLAAFCAKTLEEAELKVREIGD
jgi:exodeoxyribonuclease VII small subunit